MSIIYNNKVVAGKYAQQVVADADTVNAGIIKIATEEQINEGTDNTTAVTPFYLAQKQDKISAGDDIVINNNEISCTIKPDEQTIVRKNNGTMQCIGQLTKSNTLKFDWEGTQAEYNVAYLNGTIQPDWYCYITDDEQFVDYDDLCNKSLSNLRPDGEARFDAKLNLNLDNINEEGEKKLNISKMYYTNDVYTEEKGYNQLLEMQRSTFDLSKFTVVGSPTITDDGVASGFSSGNYIYTPTISLAQKNWEIVTPTYIFSSAPTSNQALLSSRSIAGFHIYYTSSNTITLDIGDGSTWANGLGTNIQTNFTPPLNTDIIFKLKFIYGEGYYFYYSLDGVNFTLLYQGSTTSYIPDMGINVGINRSSEGAFLTNGYTDLKQFSITVYGKEVFSGNKTGLDVINEIEIPYTLSKTGSKIVDVAYRDRVIDLYEQEGKAKYYTIDETNKNFTIPMGEIYGMIENIKNTKSGGSGLEIGDISMALYVDETKGLRRYLNGQIVDINTNTQAFLNRLLEIKNTNPEYFTTEENWQSEATLNIDGCVYKFVLNYSGETVVSVRLPKYPDYVEINAGGTLPVAGNGMTLGLTDGTSNGALVQWGATTAMTNAKGALYGKNVGTTTNASDPFATYAGIGVVSDPTKSGIQTTLKQTKLKMRYFIQIATGSETEANIVNTLENVNGFTLLESKYSDKPLYNECWLLSNNQWNPGGVYITAYEGLQVEHNTGIEVGTTVTLPSGVSYTKRGLSVKLSTETYTDYDFVLNTAEETFRLPLLDGSENLPSDKYDNLTLLSSGSTYTAPANGWFRLVKRTTAVGQSIQFNPQELYRGRDNSDAWMYQFSSIANQALTITLPVLKGQKTWCYYSADGETVVFEFIYTQGNGSLYYYVGDLDQNHGIVNMGRIGEQLAGKLDRSAVKAYITETYQNGTSWYRVYSDGWCEQGGLTSSGTGTKTINLLKQYSSTTYSILMQPYYNTTTYGYVPLIETSSKTVSSFKIHDQYAYGSNWETKGYIS